MIESLTTLAITVLLAVALFVAIGFIFGWFRSNDYEAELQYWVSAKLHCPKCQHSYEEQCITPLRTFSNGPVEQGAQLRCLSCLEIAYFEQSPDGPAFTGYQSQARVCDDCQDLFNGEFEAPCPVCGSRKSQLAAKRTAVMEATSEPN